MVEYNSIGQLWTPYKVRWEVVGGTRASAPHDTKRNNLSSGIHQVAIKHPIFSTSSLPTNHQHTILKGFIQENFCRLSHISYQQNLQNNLSLICAIAVILFIVVNKGVSWLLHYTRSYRYIFQHFISIPHLLSTSLLLPRIDIQHHITYANGNY